MTQTWLIRGNLQSPPNKHSLTEQQIRSSNQQLKPYYLVSPDGQDTWTRLDEHPLFADLFVGRVDEWLLRASLQSPPDPSIYTTIALIEILKKPQSNTKPHHLISPKGKEQWQRIDSHPTFAPYAASQKTPPAQAPPPSPAQTPPAQATPATATPPAQTPPTSQPSTTPPPPNTPTDAVLADSPEDTYTTLSQTYREILDGLLEFASETNANLSAKHLRKAKQLLEERCFYVVVVGTFSRGKSTFLNALLGADVLPTHLMPTTAISTFLRYGATPQAKVWLHTSLQDATPQTAQEIPLDQLQLYLNERHNRDNQKGVLRVDITYPSEFLQSGVVLIDTPGIGSLWNAHKEVTWQYIPQADALIFLTDSKELDATEIQFIEQTRQHTNRFFVVQNMIDLYTPEEQQIIQQLNLRTFQKLLHTNPPLYPVSAKRALQSKKAPPNEAPALWRESRFEPMQIALRNFLLYVRGQSHFSATLEQAQQTLQQLLALQQTKLDSLLRSEQQQTETKTKASQLLAELNKTKSSLKDLLQRKRDELQAELRRVQQKHRKDIEAAISQLFNTHPAHTLQQKLTALLEEIVTQSLQSLEQHVVGSFTQIYNQHALPVLESFQQALPSPSTAPTLPFQGRYEGLLQQTPSLQTRLDFAEELRSAALPSASSGFVLMKLGASIIAAPLLAPLALLGALGIGYLFRNKQIHAKLQSEISSFLNDLFLAVEIERSDVFVVTRHQFNEHLDQIFDTLQEHLQSLSSTPPPHQHSEQLTLQRQRLAKLQRIQSLFSRFQERLQSLTAPLPNPTKP